MNKCKVLAVLILVVMLVSALSIVVFATPGTPYGSYGAYLSIGWLGAADTASVSITRCSCLPVDNYLIAWGNYQYRSGNDYPWAPGPTSEEYYYSEGSNIESAGLSFREHYIYFVNGLFWASCSGGSTHSYSSTAQRQ